MTATTSLLGTLRSHRRLAPRTTLAAILALFTVALIAFAQTAVALPTSMEVGGRMAGECALDGADTDRASWDACCAQYAKNCIRNCEGMGHASGTCTDLCNSALTQCMDAYEGQKMTLPTRPLAPTSPGIKLEPKSDGAPELDLLMQ